jgi:hypothetical protein
MDANVSYRPVTARTMRDLAQNLTSPAKQLALVLCAATMMAATVVMARTIASSRAPMTPRVIGISGLCVELPQRTPIVFGARLKPGQKFRFPYPRQSTDHIDLLLPDGHVYTVDCWGWFTCWWNHEVPASEKENGFAAAALEVMETITLPPDRQEYESANVRGGSSIGEMVMESRAGRVDVTPMLLDAAPGTYELRFTPHPASAVSALAQTFTITLPALDPEATRLGPIWPGLYAVTIAGPTGANYWVLVTGESGYHSAERALRNARTLTDGWGDNISQQSVHNFLRAYLVALARQRGIQ